MQKKNTDRAGQSREIFCRFKRARPIADAQSDSKMVLRFAQFALFMSLIPRSNNGHDFRADTFQQRLDGGFQFRVVHSPQADCPDGPHYFEGRAY